MPPTYLAVYWAVGLFVLGACIGSFLNVCIYRLPAGMSIVWPPSRCSKCRKSIAWYDNLPVLSYLLLRGRCRHCGTKFSIQYALVEALTGLVFCGFYLAYFLFQVRGEAFARWDVYAVHMALISALLVSSVIDFKTKEIYTVITNGGMVLGVVLCTFFPALQSQSHTPAWSDNEHLNGLLGSLLGLVVGGGMIWVTAVLGKLAFRREAMGFGDVLLVGMIGAVLGWPGAVLTYFLAPFFGLVFGLWQYLRHREHEVPYGPFLSMAAVLVMLTQGEIVAWFAPGLEGLQQATHGGY